MMMTMHPASVVTSPLERTSDHVPDPYDMRILAAELTAQSRNGYTVGSAVGDDTGRSNRKRLKSAGDTGSVHTGPSSPRDPSSSKKPSIFSSLFPSRGQKNKSSKLRPPEASADETVTTATAVAAKNEVLSNDDLTRNGASQQQPLSIGIGAKTADACPQVVAATVDPTSSFSQRKGFNRSISIPASAAVAVYPLPTNSATFHPGDGYHDFPCKYDCPQTPSSRTSMKNQSSIESCGSSSISEVVQVLSGPPLNNTPDIIAPVSGNDDRSPLLDGDKVVGSRLASTAATSFDNIAVNENDVTSCSAIHSALNAEPDYSNCKAASSSPALQAAPSRPSTAAVQSTMAPPTSGSSSTSWWNISKTNTGGSSNASGVATGNTNLPKKRKPRLSINLPSSSKESGGMRQLSASEERKIDEAMLLASKLASMSTFAALPSPKSISGSSKESLESPALGSSSASSFFFGGLRRRHPSEKKTFVDGLQATLSVDVAQQIFTADAQAAYNQLVASSPPPGTEGDSVQSKAPSTRRQEFKLHRLQLLDSPLPRHPPPVEVRRQHQRSSLSESDEGVLNGVTVLPLALQSVSSSKSRAGSKRSISLSDDTTPTTEFRIEMTSSTATSESTLSPAASVSGEDSSRSIKMVPELPSVVASDSDRPPSPPPRLPPRIPIRPSTVNNRPRQRRYQLASSSSMSSKTSSNIGSNSAPVAVTGKQRSASEALPTTASADVTSRRAAPLPPALDVALPRRLAKSTAATVDQKVIHAVDNQRRQRHPSSAGSEHSDISSKNHRSSSSSDDSSVFGPDEDPADNPPSSPAPLPPQYFVGGNQPRGSLGSSFHAQNEQQRGAVRQLSATGGNSCHTDGSRVRMNARQLGFDDAGDEFWRYPVDFRLFCHASTALRRGPDVDGSNLEVDEDDVVDGRYSPGPAAFRYDTSDAVSYEDIMDFALEGPPETARKESVNDGECDEVRLMRKLISKDITVDECMDALEETHWHIYSAIKLVKLNKLLRQGFANEDQCKTALMSCHWDVEKAIEYLRTSAGND